MKISHLLFSSVLFLTSCSQGIPDKRMLFTNGLFKSSGKTKPVLTSPLEAITTPFDAALSCMGKKVSDQITFSVGTISDTTGKADSGSGTFITQGTGDIVQSALYEAGVTVLNRRDPNIPIAEGNWGISDIKTQTASNFYVTGSINSLDFIPGGGTQIEIAGIGPRWKESRILIGIDLAMTSAHDGRIVANSSIQKQLFAKEVGFSIGRFFNNTLIYAQAGGIEREALHHTLRQVLHYAVFDLIAQVVTWQNASNCFDLIEDSGLTLHDDTIPHFGDGKDLELAISRNNQSEIQKNSAEEEVAVIRENPIEAVRLGNTATSFAAKAIAAADSVLTAKDAAEAADSADQSLQFMTQAVQNLRAAAAKDLSGAEGDAVATLVEKAIASAQAAQKMALDIGVKEREEIASRNLNNQQINNAAVPLPPFLFDDYAPEVQGQ